MNKKKTKKISYLLFLLHTPPSLPPPLSSSAITRVDIAASPEEEKEKQTKNKNQKKRIK